MNSMMEKSKNLAALLVEIGTLKVAIHVLEIDLKNREMELTPFEGGWQGKNESERSISRQRALTSDEKCRSISNLISSHQIRLITLDSEADAIRAELDGLRWSVRNETNITLGGHDQLDPSLAQQDDIQETGQDVSQAVGNR